MLRHRRLHRVMDGADRAREIIPMRARHAVWTLYYDKQGHRNWILRTLERSSIHIADVKYLGDRQWQGQVFWDGKSTWWIVGSTIKARRMIERWLDQKHWDGPYIQNGVTK